MGLAGIVELHCRKQYKNGKHEIIAINYLILTGNTTYVFYNTTGFKTNVLRIFFSHG